MDRASASYPVCFWYEFYQDRWKQLLIDWYKLVPLAVSSALKPLKSIINKHWTFFIREWRLVVNMVSKREVIQNLSYPQNDPPIHSLSLSSVEEILPGLYYRYLCFGELLRIWVQFCGMCIFALYREPPVLKQTLPTKFESARGSLIIAENIVKNLLIGACNSTVENMYTGCEDYGKVTESITKRLWQTMPNVHFRSVCGKQFF